MSASIWSGLTVDKKADANFQLRPSLAVNTPSDGFVEPIEGKESLPNNVRDALINEMAVLAHNSETNQAAYKLLKQLNHLGKVYSKAPEAPAKNSEKKAATPPEEFVNVQSFTDSAITTFVDSISDKHAFFSEALATYKSMPMLGLSQSSVPSAFSQLSHSGLADSAATRVLANSSEDLKLEEAAACVALESALARGCYNSALAAAGSFARNKDARVFSSSLMKLYTHTPAARTVSAEEKEFDGKMASLGATSPSPSGDFVDFSDARKLIVVSFPEPAPLTFADFKVGDVVKVKSLEFLQAESKREGSTWMAAFATSTRNEERFACAGTESKVATCDASDNTLKLENNTWFTAECLQKKTPASEGEIPEHVSGFAACAIILSELERLASSFAPTESALKHLSGSVSEDVVPKFTPPTPSPAALQLHLSKETFLSLSAILTTVVPVYAQGDMKLDDAQYTACLHIIRACVNLLQVHIYQLSISTSSFSFPETAAASLQTLGDVLAKPPAARDGFDLTGLQSLVQQRVHEWFLSAMDVFYPTTISKFEFAVHTLLQSFATGSTNPESKEKAEKDSKEEDGKDDKDAVGMALLVSTFDMLVPTLEKTPTDEKDDSATAALAVLSSQLTKVFELYTQNLSSVELRDLLQSVTNKLSHRVWFQIDSQQREESSKEVPTANFCENIPAPLWKFFVQVQKQYLSALSAALASPNLNESTIFGGANEQVLASFYLISSPQRQESSLSILPTLLECATALSAFEEKQKDSNDEFVNALRNKLTEDENRAAKEAEEKRKRDEEEKKISLGQEAEVQNLTTRPTPPPGARRITLQHIETGRWACRGVGQNRWLLQDKPTELWVTADTQARDHNGRPSHIRQVAPCQYMRHYNGDADCFTQNYTDSDTAWRFSETSPGSGEWEIVNTAGSGGPRYLSYRENDWNLRVPNAGECPDQKKRLWRITTIAEVPVFVKPDTTPAFSAKHMLYQFSAQTLLCLLRGPPPTADEKKLNKWISSKLFSGGFPTTETPPELVANHALLNRLNLVETKSDVPVDESVYDPPPALIDHLRSLEPRQFVRKNLKSVRNDTIQIRTMAFGVALKHNGQIDLAEDLAEALITNKEHALVDRADDLNLLNQTWVTLMPLQPYIVLLKSTGADVKEAVAVVLERLTLLAKLTAAAQESKDLSLFPLERHNSLEMLRQKSNDATDARVAAAQRAKGRWSKARKVLSALRNTMAPISALKAVLKARESVAEDRDNVNPAFLLIQDIIEFVKLPATITVERVRAAMAAQRMRALGRVLSLHTTRHFLKIAQKSNPTVVALFAKHVSAAFNRNSPMLYPEPKYNGYCPTHPCSGFDSVGQRLVHAVQEAFSGLLVQFMEFPGLFQSEELPLYLLNLLAFEVSSDDLNWLPARLVEFLGALVSFSGSNVGLLEGSETMDLAVRDFFRTNAERLGQKVSASVRKSAWAVFRLFVYAAVDAPDSVFSTRLLNTLYLNIFQVSKQIPTAVAQEARNPFLLAVSASDALSKPKKRKKRKKGAADVILPDNQVEHPVPVGYRTILLRHVKSGWYAARKPGSHWHAVPQRTVLCAYTEGENHHIRWFQGSEHMRHYSGDYDNFSQNSRDRDTAWKFIETDTPDVFRLQNITCMDRYLSMTPLGNVDNKLYVPNASQNNDPEMWDWEIEWDAPQIYTGRKSATQITVPGRNRVGFPVAFGTGESGKAKLYCGRTGVIEQPKPAGQEHALPSDHKTVILRHKESGWYASRGGSHWHLRPERTVLFLHTDSDHFHIREAASNTYMRHYSGDYDNFTQSSRDNDTRWYFRQQDDGSYWIQNWSAHDRYLSCNNPGQVDNKLYVPTSGQQPDIKNRNWEVEFDPPQVLPVEQYPDVCGTADGKQCPDCEWATEEGVQSCLNELGNVMSWGSGDDKFKMFCGVGDCTAAANCHDCKVSQAQVLTSDPALLRIAQTCSTCTFINPLGVAACGLCKTPQEVIVRSEKKEGEEDDEDEAVDWANLGVSATSESVGNLWIWNSPSSLTRTFFPNSAEMSTYLAQLWRVLLRCSYQKSFRDNLTDKKWTDLIIAPCQSSDSKVYALAHDQLLFRLAGRVLPFVDPNAVSGANFVTHLLQRIGKGACPDMLAEEKDEKDSKEENDSKVVTPELEIFMRGRFNMECTTELIDLYRCLFSDTHARYGDDWRALVEQQMTQALTTLSDSPNLRTSLAALVVLGGLVDPVRVGARVSYERQEGTIVDWTFLKAKGFVKTVSVRLDTGEAIELKSLDDLTVLPNQPVPYHRMQAKKVLLTLVDFCTAESTANNPRQRLTEAILKRHALKVLSALVARPVLSRLFATLPAAQVERLSALAQTASPLPSASKGSLEERMRALMFFERPEFQAQKKAGPVVVASATPVAGVATRPPYPYSAFAFLPNDDGVDTDPNSTAVVLADPFSGKSGALTLNAEDKSLLCWVFHEKMTYKSADEKQLEGVPEPPPAPGSNPIPAEHKTIMMRHQASGWYAARGGRHWHLRPTRAVLCAWFEPGSTTILHIREIPNNSYMRHYGGDWDNYTQSSRDNDTKYELLPQADGSWWIQNCSARERYLSATPCPPLGSTEPMENKLYVPNNGENSDHKQRNWIIEFDAPEIEPPPCEDVNNLIALASAANVTAVESNGLAKYSSPGPDTEWRGMYGDGHGLYVRQNKLIESKTAQPVIIDGQGAIGMTSTMVMTSQLELVDDGKSFAGLTASVSFANQVAEGETQLLALTPEASATQGLSAILKTADFKEFHLVLNDLKSSTACDLKFAATCFFAAEDKKNTVTNTITLVQSSAADKQVSFRVFVGEDCVLDTSKDTSYADFGTTLANTRASPTSPVFAANTTITCQGFTAAVSNLCVWRFALTSAQVVMFATQRLTAFVDEYKEATKPVPKQFVKFSESTPVPKNVHVMSQAADEKEAKLVSRAEMKLSTDGITLAQSTTVDYRPNISENKHYTLSVTFSISAFPETTATLLDLQPKDTVNAPTVTVNATGQLALFGKPSGVSLSVGTTHNFILTYSKLTGYGFATLDTKLATFFQNKAVRYMYGKQVHFLSGVAGSLLCFSLDSTIMDLDTARKPQSSLSQVDFVEGLLATGMQSSWIEKALQSVERPSEATEWMLSRFDELQTAYVEASKQASRDLAIANLAALGFPSAWCSTALTAAAESLLPDEAKIVAAGQPDAIRTLFQQKALAWLFANLNRLVAENPNVSIDPILSLKSAATEEEKSVGVESSGLISDDAKETDSSSSLSFYTAGSSGSALEDVPSKVPNPLTEKSSDSEKKSFEATNTILSEFVSTRLQSEQSLTSVYARTTLLNVLAGTPQKVLEREFSWLMRAVEHSLPENLPTLRDLFVKSILAEAGALADVAPPTPVQGLMIDVKRAPVISLLIQETLYQLLSAVKSDGELNEANSISGNCKNPRLALFLLDLFYHVTSDLAERKDDVTASHLVHLRPILFNPVVVGLVFEVISVTTDQRLPFLRIMSSLLHLNKAARTAGKGVIYFEPKCCRIIKSLMVKVYKTKTGPPTPFLRALVEFTVGVELQLQEQRADAEKVEQERLVRSTSLNQSDAKAEKETKDEEVETPAQPVVDGTTLETFWPFCQYSMTGDTNGVLYFLGSRMGMSDYKNPAITEIATIEVSELRPGFILNDVLNRDNYNNAGEFYLEGKATAPAWFSVSIGNWLVRPYCYSLRAPHGSEYLRNWNFQGRLDDGPWVTLSEHAETASLANANMSYTWPLFMSTPEQCEQMYNSFRIIMTGKNAGDNYNLRCGGFEVYGQLSRRPAADDKALQTASAAAPVDEKEGAPAPAPAPVEIANPQWFTGLYDMLQVSAFFRGHVEAKQLPEQYASLAQGYQLSRGAWGDLAAVMNLWSSKNEQKTPEPANVDISEEGLRAFARLANAGLEEKQIQNAMEILMLFNRQVASCMDFVDLQLPPKRSVLVDEIRSGVDLIFFSNKTSRWTAALSSTQRGENRATINVDPMAAATFQASGRVDEKANQLFWGQAFQQLRNRPSTDFMISFGGRAFKCDYAGMRSIDAGGPYRDVIEHMSMDLMTPQSGLFLPSPNQTAKLGENRSCMVPNPGATSRLQLEQFEFVGKMMGLALRTRNLFAVQLPSVVWKALVGAPITLDDIANIDILSTNALKALRLEEKNMPTELYNSEMKDIKFTVTGSDGKVRPLCPQGEMKSLTYDNRQEYAALIYDYRINEFSVQSAAIRRGLGKVVPLAALGLFAWNEVETMVCGKGFSSEQVELLKLKTQYQSYNATDQHIVWFWDILTNDFTDEQRAMYLTFVWGRSRLPSTAAEFDTPHKISSRGGGNDAFPMAHTCFFTIDLPQYTDRTIMSQRLATAISMCGVIDGD